MVHKSYNISLTREINDESTKKLFNLLSDLKFSKIEKVDRVIFVYGEEMIVVPSKNLQEYHFMATRKQLDMNGHITMKEFDKIFI